jgi:hypothetical protein
LNFGSSKLQFKLEAYSMLAYHRDLWTSILYVFGVSKTTYFVWIISLKNVFDGCLLIVIWHISLIMW